MLDWFKGAAMRRSLKVQRIRGQRNSRGNALVLSVVAVVLLTFICTPLIIFYANMSAQLTVREQATHIAAQTAQVVDDYKYWLDAPRPGYAEDVALKTATDAAHSMSERMGLSDPKVTITFETDESGNQITICRLEADARSRLPARVNVFGFDMGTLFPGTVDVMGRNTHSPGPPYALMHMDAPTIVDESTRRPLGFNQRDVVVIPTYGFFYNATGQAGNPNTTPYGKGIAQISPENFFAMNHYHLKKSDIDHVVLSGQDVQLDGWNRTRLINGKTVTF